MNLPFFRDLIDCCVKVGSILYFSSAMEKRKNAWGIRIGSLALMIVFMLGQHGYRMSYKSVTKKVVEEEFCQEQGEEVEDFFHTFCVYGER